MKGIAFVVLAGFIAVLSSCEKDDQNSSDYRVKQIITYVANNENHKFIFDYDGERLKGILRYDMVGDTSWVEDYKVEITYGDNTASRISSYKVDGNWELSEKIDYTFENDQILEESCNDYYLEAWRPWYKYTYQYSGNKLIGWEDYSFANETYDISRKGEYLYNNNRPVTYYEYETFERNLVQRIKKEYLYSGDMLSTWINYYNDGNNNWIYGYKWDNSYSNNKITESNRFSIDDSTNDWEISPGITQAFIYDNHGNLVEDTWIYTNYGSGYKTNYEYEPGKGNAKYFWYNQTVLNYGEPTLNKSTDFNQDKFVPYYKRKMIQ